VTLQTSAIYNDITNKC